MARSTQAPAAVAVAQRVYGIRGRHVWVPAHDVAAPDLDPVEPPEVSVPPPPAARSPRRRQLEIAVLVAMVRLAPEGRDLARQVAAASVRVGLTAQELGEIGRIVEAMLPRARDLVRAHRMGRK